MIEGVIGSRDRTRYLFFAFITKPVLQKDKIDHLGDTPW
jgi:hypothetical protein